VALAGWPPRSSNFSAVDLIQLQLTDTIRDQLDETLELLRAVLRDDLVAAYLYGSATLGGLKPRSDVDLLIVSARATTLTERQKLGDALMRISAHPSATDPRRPIELTLVVAADVTQPRLPPVTDFQYGEWLRGAFEDGRVSPANANDPDLLVLLTEVRQHGLVLIGRPAQELIGFVAAATLNQAMVATIPALTAPDKFASDTANVLLTLARIWTTLSTGQIVPKDVAADWAIARLAPDESVALEQARATYRAGTYESWDVPIDAANVTAAALLRSIEGTDRRR